MATRKKSAPLGSLAMLITGHREYYKKATLQQRMIAFLRMLVLPWLASASSIWFLFSVFTSAELDITRDGVWTAISKLGFFFIFSILSLVLSGIATVVWSSYHDDPRDYIWAETIWVMLLGLLWILPFVVFFNSLWAGFSLPANEVLFLGMLLSIAGISTLLLRLRRL
jgi:hypothetical protein